MTIPVTRAPDVVADQPPGRLERVALDSSFVIDFLEGAEASLRWQTVLRGAHLVSVAAGEVFYKTFERSGVPAGDQARVILALGIVVDDVPLDVATRFPELRAIDAARRAEQRRDGEKAASLSLADLCVLGHALVSGSPVLTGDTHWSTLGAHGLTVPVINFRDLDQAP